MAEYANTIAAMSGAVESMLVVAGCVGVALLPAVIAAWWERRPIQPYVKVDDDDALPPTQVAHDMNLRAQSLAFAHAAVSHDAKPHCKARYDHWVSDDGLVLAIIGGGTMVGMSVNGAWLYSLTADGQLLCTTTIGGEADISGVVSQHSFPMAEFDGLVSRHRKRLADRDIAPLSAEDPVALYAEFNRVKVDAMVDRGLAYYSDEDRSAWRHTLRGALYAQLIAFPIDLVKRGLRMVGIGRRS